ncbi:radical SAM protein [Alkalibacter mobilis]|uniref:radical SAM protein n=1 Tax=Alkalibacter mobilis TaxID=2787712 RepID=UPI00189C731C|nr:radical SAM protein [Alkalibacter mobilis]MBF7097761.1 radical SAM protein [Alkalibacter mobilis]
MLLTSLLRIILTRSFRPFEFKNDYENKLEYESLENLGLYVHIPFCRSLCSFCPYCKEKFDKERADLYKVALLKEIELVGKYQKNRKKVTSLYFGGGTPALMIDDLCDIIDRLQQYFEITGGIGIELHPDDIIEVNLQKLKAAGISMVSLGIQSLDEDCLEKLGRSNRDFIQKMDLVKKAEFEVIDVDLIFAIPGQTEETLLNDIDMTFKMGATQVSTYPFIDFTFADNKYKPMGKKKKKKLLRVLSDHCSVCEIKRTSVWTFAKSETKKYSSVTRDAFLGFGVSSTTLLKNTFKINTFSIEEYIKRVDSESLPTALTINFTPRQRAVYYLFWSAYGMELDPVKFNRTLGASPESFFKFELWFAEKIGFVKRERGIYRLTDKASYIYHNVEQAYTTAYIDKMWGLLRLNPFPEKMILK